MAVQKSLGRPFSLHMPVEELVHCTRKPVICAGYCGADLKALCAEAALAALRRR